MKHVEENTKSFPLVWPKGKKRTPYRTSSRFGKKPIATAFKALKTQLARYDAKSVVVSTNLRLKANEEPYAVQSGIDDPGVAVYFTLGGQQYCFPCDRWDRVEHNLWAIAKHIEAVRGQERWGVSTIEEAFSGFRMLQAESSSAWWDVLGIKPSANEAEIQKAYRAAASASHPDRGGNEEAMQRINVARDQALDNFRRGHDD